MGKMHHSWPFLAEHGFHGSRGVTHVSGYKRGGRVDKAVGPEAHVKQRGPEKGSAPTAHHPPAPSKRPSTGGEHRYAKGGKVKGGPTHVHPVPKGEMLAYRKGGLHAEKEDSLPNEHQKGFEPEDQEEHEHDTGFVHDDPEVGEHYEAAKGGSMHINPKHKGKFTRAMGEKEGHLTSGAVEKGLHSKSGLIRKEANFARMARRHFKKLAHGGHVKAPQRGPIQSKAHLSHLDDTEADNEHSHFLSSHKLASHHGLKHDKHGHDDHKHHAPPHGTHGFDQFARGGLKKMQGGGPTRPPGMPRSPMLGMKRMRHGPNQRQMPGIPGMAPVATSPLGMGAGTAPRVMKRGGRK